MTDLLVQQRVLATSFSFYLSAHQCKTKPEVAHSAAELGDAIVIGGPGGPTEARRLQCAGFSTPVLFDGQAYAGRELPSTKQWIANQASAGATIKLLPGAFVEWDKTEHMAFADSVASEARLAVDLGATV